jgi:hypothetical protein
MRATSQFEFLDRRETAMPADYLPTAPGVLFAGQELLSAAGYIPGSSRPSGWSRPLPGDYRKRVGKHVLEVRQCGNSGSNDWTIERYEFFDYKGMEALVFLAGDYMPIWARTYQAAMRVAEYCYPIARPPIAGRWELAC